MLSGASASGRSPTSSSPPRPAPPAWPAIVEIPEELRREILLHYGDLLRAGRLRLGGGSSSNRESGLVAEWTTTGADMSTLLSRFTAAFQARLAEAVALSSSLGCVASAATADSFGLRLQELLGQVVFYVCKATSMNYCIWEVVAFLQKRLGVSEPLTIQTYDDEEQRPLMEYVVHLLPGSQQLAVELRWRRPAGVFRLGDPGDENGDGLPCRVTCGRLRHVYATFPIPLSKDYRLEYEIDFDPAVGWKSTLWRYIAGRGRVLFGGHSSPSSHMSASETLRMRESQDGGRNDAISLTDSSFDLELTVEENDAEGTLATTSALGSPSADSIGASSSLCAEHSADTLCSQGSFLTQRPLDCSPVHCPSGRLPGGFHFFHQTPALVSSAAASTDRSSITSSPSNWVLSRLKGRSVSK